MLDDLVAIVANRLAASNKPQCRPIVIVRIRLRLRLRRALTGGQDRPLWRRGRVMTASSDPSLTLEELIQVCDQIDAECDCPVMIGPDKIDYSKDAGKQQALPPRRHTQVRHLAATRTRILSPTTFNPRYQDSQQGLPNRRDQIPR